MKYQSDFTLLPGLKKVPISGGLFPCRPLQRVPPGQCGEFFGRHFRCSLSTQFGLAVCANITSTLLDFFMQFAAANHFTRRLYTCPSTHSLKKKVLKSLCEIITYEMELSYGTSIFRRETKFNKHDRFWTTNVSCPELRNVKVTNEFHWQLDYNPRVVKLFGMQCKI